MSVLRIGFAQQQSDSLKVQELDEVVVSDTRFNLSRENSGKVITKITSKDLEHLSGQSIAEIIGRTAGIEINGVRSNAGQNLNYIVRGGRNRQVLVLIDGIQVSDPSQISNDYDLRLLNADQVESIEILKGASSTLYGTGAASAVINIKLKEAAKKPIQINIKGILGTNNIANEKQIDIADFRNTVAINGSLGRISYLTSFGHVYTNGLSAIAAGNESDAFNSYNGNFKLGYRFDDHLKINAYYSFDRFKADFDNSFGMMDADHRSFSNQNRVGLSSNYKYNKGSLIINAAINTVEREIDSDFPSIFKSSGSVIDAYNRYDLSKNFNILTGVNIQNNKMESFTIPFGDAEFTQDINPENAVFTIVDPYVNTVFISDFGLNINAGLRFNNHSEYGTYLVYSINPSFKEKLAIGYLKGLVSFSTAFITPSLYQLFEPTYGNTELQPEENQTFEIGAELAITDKALLSLVYFNRKEEQFIDFVDTGGFVFQYRNIDESFTASGLELTSRITLTDELNINTNLTYTKVNEDLNLRIPKIKINSKLDYQIFKNTLISLSYQFNDDRNDLVFNTNTFESERINLKPFTLVDVFISQQVIFNKMTCFATVTNLFDENYQELVGFTTRGRNVSLGFNLNL